MKVNKIARYIALICILITSFGCAPTGLYISNTIPSTMQQNINTAEGKDISFKFLPHPSGDLIEVKIGPMWDASYSINQPFKGLTKELLETKFSEITDNSLNKITVKITELESKVHIGALGTREAYSLKMVINVELEKEGDINNKRFSYSFDMPIRSGFSNANMVFKKELSDGVKELLLKFVISIDKYIDSNRL
ncbi:MAG: hypothetical protein IIB95_13790 [Candidatus Marinimicrobia bacterium]|nr:hypothetical protein [Candidatus Neomarinimicrobiota bacterium]